MCYATIFTTVLAMPIGLNTVRISVLFSLHFLLNERTAFVLTLSNLIQRQWEPGMLGNVLNKGCAICPYTRIQAWPIR